MAGKSIQLLQQMPVFGGLKPKSLELILAHSKILELETDRCFFQEGDPGESLYVLESGSIIVEKDWQGTPIELGRLGSGDCFGEMALIDLQARSASVRATSDCVAIEIDRRALLALYGHDLEQYAIIMMNMGREVSRRLRIIHEKLFVLQQESETMGDVEHVIV